MSIIQDFKDWRDAKRIADGAKSEFEVLAQQNFEHCHAYPCFYKIVCDGKEMSQIHQNGMIYKTFCKDCSAFKVLTKVYESQKAKQKLFSNFIFWKQHTK